MSIPGAASPLFIGAAAAAATEFKIDRSLRFNSADSAYLNRTPSSAGNRKTWTWSGWLKRNKTGHYSGVFGGQVGSNTDGIYITNADEIYVPIAGQNHFYSPVLRDLSAWYHIVVAVDTTQATNTNRIKTYINGVELTSSDVRSAGWPAQDAESGVNNTGVHTIGRNAGNTGSYGEYYLAEVNFVDGLQLPATDFGEYDDNNVWQPKEFTGSYDQSAGGRTIANSTGAVPLLNTSDADGQTVSSGVRTDSNASSIVLALPLNGSNGGTTITDYHHTIKGSGSAKAITLFSGSSSGGAVTSTAVSKYYGSSFYVVRGGVNANQSDYITRTGDSDLNLGTGDFCVEFWFHPTSLDTNFVMFDNRHPTDGWPNSSDGFAIIGNGSGDIFLYHGGNQRINHSAKLTVNTWHHIAVTRDSGTERLFVDGDFFSSTYSSSNNYNESRFLLGSSAPNGEGSTGYFQDLRIYVGAAKYTSNFSVPAVGVGGVNSFYLKFADNSSNAALGTDSSGLSNTWTVNNFDAGAVVPNQGFNVVTWTGDGSSSRAIKLGFQPDFLWIKRRDTSYDHYLWDSIRGITKEIHTNLDYAEGTATNKLASFDSDGFTVKNQNGVNGNGFTYVAWAWKAGGTASSNTDGTITSSVSASAKYGFSVVSFTGDGSGTDTIGHGLNTAPKLIILKDRDNANDWLVYTDQIDGSWDYLKLNKTDAKSNSSYSAATSSVFSYGTDAANYIAYCFSEVSGFSKFGSYTGNGSSTGPIVTTGFKPKFVLIRNTSRAENWIIYDSLRNNFTSYLVPNVGDAEGSFTQPVIQRDDGFQLGDTRDLHNRSGDTYIYAAFADGDGSGIDSLIDTPTNYTAGSGNNGGNYATWNPLQKYAAITLSNGNLDFTDSNSVNGGDQGVHATIRPLSGKFYWEMTLSTLASENYIGISKSDKLTQTLWTGGGVDGYYYYQNGKKIGGGNGNGGVSYGASFGVGDVIGVAVDWDNGKVTFYKNGSSQGDAFTGKDLTGYIPAYYFNTNQSSAGSVNFGARPFAYTPPTGYVSLCTQNLTDPTIADGSTAFLAKTFTANASNQTITTGFSPDLVWVKSRANSYGNELYDIIRGTNKRLTANTTAQEQSLANQLTSFNSDGFTLGNASSSNYTNNTASIAWAWDGGTSTVSNTDGSITTNIRASQTNGFSIVSYVGNSTAGATVGHGLSAAPEWVVCKDRDDSDNWQIYHAGAQTSGAKLLKFDTSAASSNNGPWNNTAPTNSVVTLGGGGTNDNGNNHIMYCWAPVEGYSAFGSYTGTGTSDNSAPFIFTGFRPAFILFKRTDSTGFWRIMDTARDPHNVAYHALFPNSANTEASTQGSDQYDIDFLSNGFKLRTTLASSNASSGTFIYACFAEHPLKTARAR